jgi:exopolysaccharide biosynthesis polyprenyl glycosylphosphotransferase
MEYGDSMTESKPVLRTRLWQLRLSERKALLLFGDFLAASISLLTALYLWGNSERFMEFGWDFIQRRVPLWFFVLPFIWLVLMSEQYDVHRSNELGKTIRGIVIAALIGLVVYLFFYFYYANPPRSLLPRRGIASFLITVSILTLVWRLLYIRIFTTPQFMRRVLLIGGGMNGRVILKVINELAVKPFVLVGIVDDDHRKLGTFVEGFQVIGASEQLIQIIDENQISDLIVAISGEIQSSMFQALLTAQEMGVEIIPMPTAYEDLLSRVPIETLEADWIVRTFVDQSRVNGFYQAAKRLIDIIGALVGLLGVLVILPFIALLTVLDDGWPVFYSQTRCGRGGQLYKIYKFRTMRRDAEADGKPRWAAEKDTRATRVGSFLRKTHIDELPQFLNVLRGEMSLIGPRAERPELVDLFQQHVPFYRARLLVKPGISGWAQVNFGYASTIQETIIKLEYDLYYIKHRTLWMDIVILMLTPANMLGLRGR